MAKKPTDRERLDCLLGYLRRVPFVPRMEFTRRGIDAAIRASKNRRGK